jgi:hypothetical protein
MNRAARCGPVCVQHHRFKNLLTAAPEAASLMDKHTSTHRGIPLLGAEIFVALLFVIAGGLVAFDSWLTGAGWNTDGPQSGYFPFYTGLIMAIAGLVTLVQALRNAGLRGSLLVGWSEVKRVLAVLVPALAYVWIVQLIGIYIASALYIAVFMVLLGRYAWWKGLAVGLAVNAMLYCMFEIWFQVPLFRGSYDLLGLIGR